MINPFLYGIVTTKCGFDGFYCGFDEEIYTDDEVKSDTGENENRRSSRNEESGYELGQISKSPKESRNIQLQQIQSNIHSTKKTEASNFENLATDEEPNVSENEV